MRSLKPAFGIVGALLPLLYVVGFLVYFGGVEHWTGVPVGNALGPTLLGLSVVAILLSIPLVLRIARLFGRPPSIPGTNGRREPDPPEAQTNDFDPDAVIARYLAQRPSPEQAARLPAPTLQPRPAFGRKRD